MVNQTNDANDTGKKEDSNPNDEPDNKSDDKADDKNSIYSKSLAVAERLEAANKVMTENLDRQEKLSAEKLLGGTSGGKVDVKPKEETPIEYRDRIDKEISEGMQND